MRSFLFVLALRSHVMSLRHLTMRRLACGFLRRRLSLGVCFPQTFRLHEDNLRQLFGRRNVEQLDCSKLSRVASPATSTIFHVRLGDMSERGAE